MTDIWLLCSQSDFLCLLNQALTAIIWIPVHYRARVRLQNQPGYIKRKYLQANDQANQPSLAYLYNIVLACQVKNISNCQLQPRQGKRISRPYEGRLHFKQTFGITPIWKPFTLDRLAMLAKSTTASHSPFAAHDTRVLLSLTRQNDTVEPSKSIRQSVSAKEDKVIP